MQNFGKAIRERNRSFAGQCAIQTVKVGFSTRVIFDMRLVSLLKCYTAAWSGFSCYRAGLR